MLAVPIFCGSVVLIIIGFEGAYSILLIRESLAHSAVVATIVRYFRGRRLIKKVFPLVDPKQPSLSPWFRVRSNSLGTQTL